MESVLLVMKMAVEIAALAEQLGNIAKRVSAGEQITQVDIDLAKAQADAAVAAWDKENGN